MTKKVLEFMKKALDRGKKPSVEVSIVPMTLDDQKTDEFRDYWLQVVNSISIYSTYVDANRTIMDKNLLKSYTGQRLPCLMPWIQSVIAVDGSVLPCCWDYNHSMVMGNIFRQKFYDIWHGDFITKLREKMLEGNLSDYPLCQSCDRWIAFLPYHKT